MGYSTWLYDVIRDEFAPDRDVIVDTVDGWETRGRSADHAGVMDHHTGSKAGTRYRSLLRYLVDGYPYPPAYNVATAAPHIAPDVDRHVVTVVAAGKANHAGSGGLSWMDSNDGNRRTIGIGHFSTAVQHPWGDRYLQVQRRLDACLLEHMGQSYLRRADHKEYAPARKTDRHSIVTARWDRDLRDLMAARAGGAPPEEDDVTPEDKADIIDGVVKALRADGRMTRVPLETTVLDWSTLDDREDRVLVEDVVKGLHSRTKAILAIVRALAADHDTLAESIADAEGLTVEEARAAISQALSNTRLTVDEEQP